MNSIEIAMNERQLAITFSGPLCAESAKGLIRELDCGFDYYQYPSITVRLDSPGGEIRAMRSLLEHFAFRQDAGQTVEVHASHLCASAAALVLAHGCWGTRQVEPTTHLQFHWSRAALDGGQVLTSDMAASLARGLSSVDQKTLEHLVTSMVQGAGDAKSLIDTMAVRLDQVLQNWQTVAAAIEIDANRPTPAKLTPWIKELNKHLKNWSAQRDPVKLKADIVGFLKELFQKDAKMDLRHAYALCLVDCVRGVLPPHSKQTHVSRPPIAGDDQIRTDSAKDIASNDYKVDSVDHLGEVLPAATENVRLGT